MKRKTMEKKDERVNSITKKQARKKTEKDAERKTE